MVIKNNVNMSLLSLLLLLTRIICVKSNADFEYHDTTLERVAFGSCHNRKHAHRFPEVWPAIAKTHPQAFLWTGDSVYAPKRILSSLSEEYNATSHYAPYANFISNKSIKVLGTWDDHDYGVNDGGKEVSEKDLRKHLFLNFLSMSTSSVYERGGVYSSHVFGLPPFQTKIIFLDTRTFRDFHYFPSFATYHQIPLAAIFASLTRWFAAAAGISKNYHASMLGDEQWKWLEKELKDSTSQVHVLVSSIQVFTTNPVMESWGHFHLEKLRLLRLLSDTRPSGLVIISGDVHHAEFIAPSHSDLLEVTSSGLTHSCTTPFFGFMCVPLLNLYHRHRMTLTSYFTDVNFGSIELNWKASYLTLNIHDHCGGIALNTSRPIRPLSLSSDYALPELLDGHGKGALIIAFVVLSNLLLFGLRSIVLRSRARKRKLA